MLKRTTKRRLCEHNRRRNTCVPCKGVGICEHMKRRSRCIICKGSEVCEHGKDRRICIPCKGSAICEHGRQRNTCVPCKGSSICEHGRRRESCVPCKGSWVCEHDKRRYMCIHCKGSGVCEHGKQRNMCIPCKGSGICEHGKHRHLCIQCKGPGICEHNRQRYTCVDCKGPAVCEHGKQRSKCIPCKGSGVCEHGKQRRLCIPCKGSGICKHNKQRGHCFECTPMEKALKSAYFCVCGSSKNKSADVCAQCNKNNAARIEFRIQQHLRKEVGNMSDNGRTLFGGDVCDTNRFYSDIIYHIPKLLIAVEIDEHSHIGYNTICELGKNDAYKWSFEDKGTIVLIRFNPHIQKGSDVPFNDRLDSLVHIIKSILKGQSDINFNELQTNIIYMYYGESAREKHIHLAKNTPNFNVVDINHSLVDPEIILADPDITNTKRQRLQ